MSKPRVFSTLRPAWLALAVFLGALPSCGPKQAPVVEKPAPREEGVLFRVGSITGYQADLDRELEERHASPRDEAARKKALDDLVSRAQYAQEAIDAGLARDPAVRAQFARALAARLKEQKLTPLLKANSSPAPVARLREIYQAAGAAFQSDEKRQAAVLWLNPGPDPERRKKYEEKLAGARDFYLKSDEMKAHPEQGFSVLSVDHSEHAASRFKGGALEWLGRAGGMDGFSKAVAELVFALKEPGDVSEVVSRPEGVFLVRYMALKPPVRRPFEAVAPELDRMERARLRSETEAEFEKGIKAKHPVEWVKP